MRFNEEFPRRLWSDHIHFLKRLMIYYGFDSEAAMHVVTGEHLDALAGSYGYRAVCKQNAQILQAIGEAIFESSGEGGREVEGFSWS